MIASGETTLSDPKPRAPVLIRPARPAELRLVVHSWSRGRWDALDRPCSWQEFKATDRPRLEQILRHRGAVVLVAEGTEPGYVVGWLLWTAPPFTLHWTYTKYVYRGFGVARALWDAAGLGPESRLLCTAPPRRDVRRLAEKCQEVEFMTLREFLA